MPSRASLAAFLVLLAACSGGDDGPPGDHTGPSGLVYTNTYDGSTPDSWYSRAFVVDPAGGPPLPLLSAQFQDVRHASISPDGGRVAVVGLPEGAAGLPGLYVAPLDASGTIGTPQQVFRQDGMFPAFPRWSPTGATLAFEVHIVATTFQYPQVWTVTVPGTARLVHADAEQPDWSPDGSRLLYSGIALGPDYYYRRPRTSRPDGTDVQDLFELVCQLPCTDAWNQRWGPDGRIALLRFTPLDPPGASLFEIVVMDDVRSPPATVWTSTLDDNSETVFFEWSPGGDALALLRYVDDPGPPFYGERRLSNLDLATGVETILTTPAPGTIDILNQWR